VAARRPGARGHRREAGPGRAASSPIRGENAAAIAESAERAIREGALSPGDALPTVRALAGDLGVSPATVASAYRTLRHRGLVLTQGRRGTTVAPRPPVAPAPAPPAPRGVRDLATGNPDPALLPDLAPFLAEMADARPATVLYGDAPYDAELLRLGARRLQRHGVPAEHVAVVGGALDGIERVLGAHLRPGDRVAVEDPGFTGILDLLGALGLVPAAVAVDDQGPRPDALERALRAGARALVVTPRAHNPTGAALGEDRAKRLRRVLERHRDVLLVEDDHAGAASGAPAVSLTASAGPRWAAVHSVSKTLGPDLRLAVMACDGTTLSRVEGRQLLGMRWVSHILQRLVVALWKDRETTARVKRAGRVYSERRGALVDALAARGIDAHGRSGLNVWVPVAEEAPVLAALLESGFAAAAGERFRIASPPGVRITTARLAPDEAPAVADAVAAALAPARRTRWA
jgi:DNA-binding transcriptional MocR family regulator